jgi:hypothetical protein
MALTPSTRSNASGVFRSTQTRSNSYGISNSSEPANKIPNAVSSRNIDTSDQWSFPEDIPPIHFGMIETEWDSAASRNASTISSSFNQLNSFGARDIITNPSGIGEAIANGLGTLGNLTSSTSLRGQKLYKLPLPLPLAEQFEVQYDINFQAPLDQFQQIGSAAFGFIPNTFKTVTLSQPDYRRHKFTWTLPPRNYSESERIQRILHHIKIGMHPKSTLGKWFMAFPKIYLPYFSPNPKYLFKFKPCVIENIEINYQGGQPVPSFYRPEGADENRPPETVQFTITFLELEYWLDTDFKSGGTTSLPSNDPFDSFNYYELAARDASIQAPEE